LGSFARAHFRTATQSHQKIVEGEGGNDTNARLRGRCLGGVNDVEPTAISTKSQNGGEGGGEIAGGELSQKRGASV